MKSTQMPASEHIFLLHAVKTGLAGVLALFVAQALRPFAGTARSVGWGIFVTDGSSAESTALLPSVSPPIDWVRLRRGFPYAFRFIIRDEQSCEWVKPPR
jgi:hypothetical protein